MPSLVSFKAYEVCTKSPGTLHAGKSPNAGKDVKPVDQYDSGQDHVLNGTDAVFIGRDSLALCLLTFV